MSKLEYVEEVLNVRFPASAHTVEAQMLAGAALLCVALSLYTYSTEAVKARKDKKDADAASCAAKLEPAAAAPPPSPTKLGEATGTSYASMRWRYLAVYLPGVFGDWIQGAYLYALYKMYDLSMADIGYLFMIGYSTSALLGTYAASMGDRYGHRACIVVYGAIYSLSCATMHSGDFWLLMFGRVCGGVAYSLLYSSFEAWAVAEATRCGHRDKLPKLFASSTFCNAMAAVGAGMVGHAAVEWNTHAATEGASAGPGSVANMYTLPFDVAIPALLGCSLGAMLLWREHRGGVYAGVMAPSGGVMPVGSIRQAYTEINKAAGLKSIMAMIALYESALYIFVFLWTPALESRAEAVGIASIPHGIIFSLFMTCKMAGSQVFTLVLKGPTHASHVLAFTFVLSALCFAVPLLSNSYYATLTAFSVYEAGLGLYWPAIAILRADLVPDDIRSSVASLFRVPLNGLVVVSLLVMGRMPESVVLLISVTQLTMCVWCAITIPVAPLNQHDRLHSPLPVSSAPAASDTKADQ